jgi:hypothetical protein
MRKEGYTVFFLLCQNRFVIHSIYRQRNETVRLITVQQNPPMHPIQNQMNPVQTNI